MESKLTMLMILDGFGDNLNEEGNAVKLANTPNLDKLMKKYPTTKIAASELAVRTSRTDKWEILKLGIQI